MGWKPRGGGEFNFPIGNQLQRAVMRGGRFAVRGSLGGDGCREGQHVFGGSGTCVGWAPESRMNVLSLSAKAESSSLAMRCCSRASTAVLACLARRAGARPGGLRLLLEPDGCSGAALGACGHCLYAG